MDLEKVVSAITLPLAVAAVLISAIKGCTAYNIKELDVQQKKFESSASLLKEGTPL